MNTNKPYLLDLKTDEIGYLPEMLCPNCLAGLIARDSQLYRPFQALAGPAQEYDRYFGYLSFDCTCPLNMSQEDIPALRGSLRVARLGDAVLPIDFVTLRDETLSKYGMTAREVNAARLQQVVRFLAAHADPARLAGSDTLKMVIYAVAGGSSPDAAYKVIQEMLVGQLPARKEAVRSIHVSGERIRQAARQIITWIEELGGTPRLEERIPIDLPEEERSLKER